MIDKNVDHGLRPTRVIGVIVIETTNKKITIGTIVVAKMPLNR
jgi:hypothetical protein